MKRMILLLIVIVVLAAAWYGYKLYTGKVKSLTEVKADVTLTATDLIAAFDKDSAAANKQYLGKVVEVSGTVKSVEKEDNIATVILGKEGSLASVRCSMDSAFVPQATTIANGTAVTVKGHCTGYMADELIGSDVILNRCVFTTKK